MKKNGVSKAEFEIIQSVLMPFVNQIEQVKLFGSRAIGNYRPGSDIDMVLYGELDEKTVNRIRTLLDESALSLKVDVEAYSLITYTPLKEHIDKVGVIFITQEALRYSLTH